MNKTDLKIGHPIWTKKYGNAARYLNEKKPFEDYISEYKITKIGNKYFTAKQTIHSWEKQFEILNGFEKDGFNGGEQAYLSKQEIYDEDEHQKLLFKLKKSFDWVSSKKFTLDQLKRINEIVEEE